MKNTDRIPPSPAPCPDAALARPDGRPPITRTDLRIPSDTPGITLYLRHKHLVEVFQEVQVFLDEGYMPEV